MFTARRTRAVLVGGLALPGVLVLLAAGPDNPIPSPHPQITEVLFNVPPGDAGDANQDGVRDATGDEFIELANPFKEPVSLAGYVLTNRLGDPKGASKKGFRFEFPAGATLDPSQAAVVFNGKGATFGPEVAQVGQAPTGPSASFGGALVFDAGGPSGLKNDGDWVALWAPDGTMLDVVAWGEPMPPPPRPAAAGPFRVQMIKDSPRVSVQRRSPGAQLVPHDSINAKAFSPGVIP